MERLANLGSIWLDNSAEYSYAITDSAYHLLQTNRQFREIFGLSSNGYAGKSFFELLQPGEKDLILQAVGKSLQHPAQNMHIETSTQVRDGKNKIIHWEIEAVVGEDGIFLGVCFKGEDNSLQKHKDPLTSFEHISKEFQTLSENIPAAIYEYYFNKDGTHGFKYLSPSIERLFGIPAKDFIASSDHVLPEDRYLLQRQLLQSLETNEPFCFEGRLRTRNGDIRWHKSTSCFAFETANGARMFTGIILDITEQKNIEEKYRNEEQRFHAIFNSMFQLMGLMTPDGILIELNQTALDFAGLQPLDVVGKYFWDTYYWTISPLTRIQLQQSVQRAAKGEFVRYEVEIKGKDGNNAWIDFSIKPLKDEHGTVVLLIPEGRNINEHRMLQEKLNTEAASKKQAIIEAIIEAQEKEREEISYELHDNVNQILSIGKLMLELAENQPGKMLESVQQTKYNIQKAIEEIRKLSHNLNPATVKFVGLIDAIKDILGNIHSTGKLSIKFEHAQMKSVEKIDPTIELAIFRIVQEQFNNILRHSGASKVKIKLKHKDGFIHLEISDNGKGFNMATTKKGLGLNNIFNRVEHYRGTIKMETTPEKGCLLAAVLPVELKKSGVS